MFGSSIRPRSKTSDTRIGSTQRMCTIFARRLNKTGRPCPILVRRHPTDPNRYLLVYGRRRLEAIRASDKVSKVRALIANLDDTAALRAQVSENTGRRDLSYIERALFAQELLDSGFGSQAQIAEVLNVTRSAVSMSISVAKAIGTGTGPCNRTGARRRPSQMGSFGQGACRQPDRDRRSFPSCS